MANRLADETSPYLLQHRDNPVDWHPWGEGSLKLAKDDDKPILLSIGYSACHWCHVMAHESFEDAATAAYMNEHFVPVKVDREERPDIDSIYMESVQAMTGRGGWPLTVFLDTNQVPFFGGTYFPPEPRSGMPSFRMVMEAVSQTWEQKREEVERAAGEIAGRLQAVAQISPSSQPLDRKLLDSAIEGLESQFDATNGGLGGAPKFPPASAIEFLLRRDRQGMAVQTLKAMARGGIFDQAGGGFCRYSIDDHWLIPHFEKMLYDNALLARAYLHGWQATGDAELRETCERTLDWLLAEMRGPEGGFFAALDADSEGEEGKFYVWTQAEFEGALAGFKATEIESLERYFGVTERGNFEGSNVLQIADPAAAPAELVARARERLLKVRADRIRPGLDDKRLTAWNSLAISALAEAGAALSRDDYLDAARGCADFVLNDLRDEQGRLLRTYKNGKAKLNAYLEDYAFTVEALTTLYEATFETRWFDAATELARETIDRFADQERGGFFTTAHDHEDLIARQKDIDDHPVPSGNSAAAYGLLRLGALTGDREPVDRALGVFRLLHEAAGRHPQAFGHLLCALDFHFATTREVALIGDELGPLAKVVRAKFRPHVIVAGAAPGDAEAQRAIPLLAGRKAAGGEATAYVCENFSCQLPVTEPVELEMQLDESTSPAK